MAVENRTNATARRNNFRMSRGLSFMLFCLATHSHVVACFVPSRLGVHNDIRLVLRSTDSGMDDIAELQAKAQALLLKSKAKLAENEGNSLVDSESIVTSLPFFANQQINGSKREVVTKSTTSDGLITTDGEKMAELSESEQWEVRGLSDVFESETKKSSSAVAERDVAASIYNLRKVLQNEDYKKIFDSRNRFIGEDN